MRRLLPRVALTVSLVLAGVGANAMPASAEGEFKNIDTFKLPGNLQVITAETRGSGKVTIDTWVKAGSAADFAGYPGLAYTTAQAIWEGGARPLGQQLTALGAVTKLEVGRDTTHYSVTVPSAKLAEAMDLIGAAFANPDFAKMDLTSVKTRLGAEYSRQQADVATQAAEAVMKELYGPDYGHKPIGQPESLARTTAADMQAFFDRFYVPAQVTVVLAGDFDTGNSIGQVVRSFAAHLKRTAPAGAAPSRPLAPSTERKAVGSRAFLAAGARGPAMGEQREQAVMAMLAAVLAQGDKSRLATTLGTPGRDVNAYWLPLKGPGTLVVQVSSAPTDTMGVEKAVRDILADLRNAPVSLDEHARAMNQVLTAYNASTDTLPEQAATLGFATVIGGDPLLARTYPEVVRQVSRNDMMEAAEKYLNPDAVKIVVYKP